MLVLRGGFVCKALVGSQVLQMGLAPGQFSLLNILMDLISTRQERVSHCLTPLFLRRGTKWLTWVSGRNVLVFGDSQPVSPVP